MHQAIPWSLATRSDGTMLAASTEPPDVNIRNDKNFVYVSVSTSSTYRCALLRVADLRGGSYSFEAPRKAVEKEGLKIHVEALPPRIGSNIAGSDAFHFHKVSIIISLSTSRVSRAMSVCTPASSNMPPASSRSLTSFSSRLVKLESSARCC